MDLVQYLSILFTIFVKVVFSGIVFPPGQQVCYPDVGCFDPVNLFDLGLFVPDTPAEVGTQFQLYTRATIGNNFAILDYLDNTTLQAFDNSKRKTFFLVHGINGSSSEINQVTLRKALLAKFDANVIMVDWHKGAATQNYLNYLVTAANTQLVGRQIAVLSQQLTTIKQLNIKNVHLIGFSLGGEVSGFAGKWYKHIASNTIGRISVLDAAGLWYQVQNTSYHISKTDADFVDAIHTFAGQVPIIGGVGILPPVGHVDFYPNGGRFQPQCCATILSDTGCSHEAAWEYYAESISGTCSFTSHPCPYISSEINTPLYVLAPCVALISTFLYGAAQCNGPCGNNCGNMGYYSINAPGRGSQFLTTNLQSPYCEG